MTTPSFDVCSFYRPLLFSFYSVTHATRRYTNIHNSIGINIVVEATALCLCLDLCEMKETTCTRRCDGRCECLPPEMSAELFKKAHNAII